MAVGCGDKKECRKFVQNHGGWASGNRDDRPEGLTKRPGSRRGTSKWRAAMVNMRLQSRMLNMRRMTTQKGRRQGGKSAKNLITSLKITNKSY